MQHLSDDMDELFQRAAENYTLDPGEGDWETIARKVEEITGKHKGIAPEKNKKIFTLFLLFMFLAAGSVFIQLNSTGNAVVKSNIALLKKEVNPSIENTGEKQNSTALAKAGKNNRTPANEEEHLAVKIQFSMPRQHTLPNVENRNELNPTKLAARDVAITNNNFKGNDNLHNAYLLTHHPNNEKQLIPPAQKVDSINVPPGQGLANLINEIKTGLDQTDLLSQIQQSKKTGSIITKKKGLYTGVVAGPELSKVGSRSFSNPGFNAGLIAGIRLSTAWSVESGLMLDKKNYTSEGSIFKMEKVRSTMPSAMTINNLKSRTTVLEIPVKLKYDFARKKLPGVFVSAGLSAYIVTREKNFYNVSLNGSAGEMTGVYKQNNYRLPAVASFSIGYQHEISRKVEVRISPFLNIPLQGMGVGSLPVTSTGLHLGIIRRMK